MRILVTGASGFIGKQLLKVLASDSTHELFALRRGSRQGDISGASVIVADLASRGWTDALPSGIDVVVHLAQSRFFRSFPEGADDVFKINVDATFELLEWSRRTPVNAFVYASTGTVYQPQPRLMSEDDPVRPSSLYAASKVAGEALCSAYSSCFSTTILRFFSIYGPGSSESVLPRLVRRVINSEPIELDGGVGMLTTPTYLGDCVNAIVQSVIRSSHSAGERLINICGDEEISLRDACLIVGEIMDREPRLLVNERVPLRISGKNERAKTLLQWHPDFSLRAGLAALIAGT